MDNNDFVYQEEDRQRDIKQVQKKDLKLAYHLGIFYYEEARKQMVAFCSNCERFYCMACGWGCDYKGQEHDCYLDEAPLKRKKHRCGCGKGAKL
jgi:hypothetical protein